MKRFFRQLVGFIVMSPFVLMTYLFSLFVGKEKAIKLWGSPLTSFAKLVVKLAVPQIKSASEFDRLSSGLKARFRLWRPVYDYSIAYEDSNTLKMHFSNCPFCEVLNTLGLSELGPYVCQGDWEVAKDQADKWEFERSHQIGTGDSFCDHTYKRKVAG